MSVIRFMKGTRRYVLLVGRWAIKLPRSHLGLRCNQREIEVWNGASERNREILCPPMMTLARGLVVVFARAEHVTGDEYQEIWDSPEWWKLHPQWFPEPSGLSPILETKACNWGRLNGRLVSIDYGEPID